MHSRKATKTKGPATAIPEGSDRTVEICCTSSFFALNFKISFSTVVANTVPPSVRASVMDIRAREKIYFVPRYAVPLQTKSSVRLLFLGASTFHLKKSQQGQQKR